MRSVLREFTPWIPWTNRKEQDLSRPGVYLLGRFSSLDPPRRPTLSSKLVYIGETCGQKLRGRLYQFELSAFRGIEAHSGGSTFSSTYRVANDRPSWLFVSLLPIDKPEPYGSAYIRHIERALLWEYVQHHGALPKCNRK
jgi:hypothetical protein